MQKMANKTAGRQVPRNLYLNYFYCTFDRNNNTVLSIDSCPTKAVPNESESIGLANMSDK